VSRKPKLTRANQDFVVSECIIEAMKATDPVDASRWLVAAETVENLESAKSPGLAPPRLKIDMPFEDAMRTMLRAGVHEKP